MAKKSEQRPVRVKEMTIGGFRVVVLELATENPPQDDQPGWVPLTTRQARTLAGDLLLAAQNLERK